jgi:hypothetical protein
LGAAVKECQAQHARLPDGEGKLRWGDAIAIGKQAIALLQQRDAQTPGAAREALRSALEEWSNPTTEPYRQGLWHRHRLPRRSLRRINP